MSDSIKPENTWALLIGIDDYQYDDWTLPNPTAECLRFAEWLLEKEIPPGQIKLLVKTENPSLLPKLELLKGKGVEIKDASLIEIGNNLNNPPFAVPAQQRKNSLIYFYWSGHGVSSDDHSQYLICSEAEIDYPRVFDLEDIRAKLRGGDWARFGNQSFLVNACATYDSKSFGVELTPQELPANVFGGAKARQFAVCAASPEQVAIADETAFFSVLLESLKALTADSLLPDPKALHESISAGYKKLRIDGKYGELPEPRGYFDLWSNEKLPVISLGELENLIYGKLIESRQPLSEFRKVYRQMVRQQKLIRGTADIIRDLSEMGMSQYVDLPQYVEFFERVAAQAQNAQELQDWIEPQIDDKPALIELRNRIKVDGEKDEQARLCYLYVFVPSVPPYQITYKLIDSAGKLIPTTDDLAGQLELKELTPETICHAVCAILSEDDQALNHITELHVELFLPRNLLDFAADKSNDPHDAASTLEEVYSVKLRWRDRAEGTARAQSKKWLELAKIINDEASADPQIEWFASNRSAADLSFIRWKEQAKKFAFVGLQFNPLGNGSQAMHALMSQALDQGIPYLIWPRTDGDCPACFCDEIGQAVNGIAFEETITRLQAIRRFAPKPPDHPGRYLSIFWDDPRRNPFNYDPKAMRSTDQGAKIQLTNV